MLGRGAGALVVWAELLSHPLRGSWVNELIANVAIPKPEGTWAMSTCILGNLHKHRHCLRVFATYLT